MRETTPSSSGSTHEKKRHELLERLSSYVLFLRDMIEDLKQLSLTISLEELNDQQEALAFLTCAALALDPGQYHHLPSLLRHRFPTLSSSS
jgi:hypothetical protein